MDYRSSNFMPISRPKPIVDQIDELLRQRIYDAVYPPGSRLPSESELLEEFGVSRATIRTALTRLATEGLIIRKQGDGTYVNEHLQDVNAQMGGLWEYVRLIRRSGHEAAIRELQAQARPATSIEAEALVLEPDTPVLSMTRLFLADERPVILAMNAIPQPLIQADKEDVDGSLPLRRLLQEYCGQKIAYAIFNVRATLAEDEVAETLGHEVGAPLLQINTTFYNANNEAIAYGKSYYDDAFLNLRLIQTWA